MKAILITALIVVAIVGGATVYLGFLSYSRSHVEQSADIFPDTPLIDRPIADPGIPMGTSTQPSALPSEQTIVHDARLVPPPGGVWLLTPKKKRDLQILASKAQALPPDDSGVVIRILAQASEYDIYMLPSADYEWIIDIILKTEPLNYSRALAEGEVARRLEIERDDLCGLPFNVHTNETHPAQSLGNLGLEVCGADMLTDSKWGAF